jgi:uncharacterized membrane protein YsdA (DUF1294 family)
VRHAHRCSGDGIGAHSAPVSANDLIMHPFALIAWYVLTSTIAFAAYGLDKAAAKKSIRRTPENTLHLLSLLGGWPGALLGQQVFRHKTRKLPFQLLFWVTVAANCAALAFIALSLTA